MTNVRLLQGTYSSHGVELVMVTVEDYKMIGTKITVCEEKFSISLGVVSSVAALLSMLFF